VVLRDGVKFSSALNLLSGISPIVPSRFFNIFLFFPTESSNPSISADNFADILLLLCLASDFLLSSKLIKVTAL
jgi:hypothetical protein